MITISKVKEALKQIVDTRSDENIVDLGFIRNITVDENRVTVDVLSSQTTPDAVSAVRSKVTEAVLSLDENIDVTVRIIPHQPPPKKHQHPQQPAAHRNLEQVKNIIAVSSCKGGVGKSTLAAQMAVELASRGLKVGLIDADLYGPSIPSLFQISNAQIAANADKQAIPLEKFGVKLMSFGFILGDSPAVMRGPIVTRYLQQILLSTAWGELDYLFIDMPPGTGDIQLTITQQVQLSGAIIVTTPQTLSLIDVARGILMFEKVNVPILGIIENMSYFICDQCDKQHHIFSSQTEINLEERFGLTTLSKIPLLSKLTHHIDQSQNQFIMDATDRFIDSLKTAKTETKSRPEVSFNEHSISLQWPDGENITISNKELRQSCECAMCIDEMSGQKLLKSSDIKDDIAAKEVFPLGNYALSITWNDGHSSGIYPYDHIRKLIKTSNV